MRIANERFVLKDVLKVGGATGSSGGGANGTGSNPPAWGTKVKLSDEPRVAHFKLGLQEDIAKHYVKTRHPPSTSREQVPHPIPIPIPIPTALHRSLVENRKPSRGTEHQPRSHYDI